MYLTYLSNSRLYTYTKASPETLKRVTEIRGGDLFSFVVAYAVFVIVLTLFFDTPLGGFIPGNIAPQPNNHFWPNEYKPEICRKPFKFNKSLSFRPKSFSPFQSSPPRGPGLITRQLEKPAAMPQQEYSPIPTSQKRSLPHELDQWIVVEDQPEL